MAVVHKSVLLPFSVEQMFRLVDKVEDYPAFLPWCGGVEVREREQDRLVAAININYHGVKQTFATENRNSPPTQMTMKLVEGPFRQLDGCDRSGRERSRTWPIGRCSLCLAPSAATARSGRVGIPP
jgi:ribosome-associated toxin RatA of RatAB toxin-antitoxin module